MLKTLFQVYVIKVGKREKGGERGAPLLIKHRTIFLLTPPL
jgi:hypothetical protein